MEKLKMHSPNLTDENIAKIRELFPGCVTEATDEDGKLRYAVDFDQLRQELSHHVVEEPQERYRLDWPGKRAALVAANAPVDKTLRPSRKDSVDYDTTQNLFIEGDNLEALKLLQTAYLGKVKMIYIDPPYNTGNDYIYRDNFAESTEDYLSSSGHKNELGNVFLANRETSGRFHSNWLSMMYSRLRLARNLLKPDGVIFISIDDGEVGNLRKCCDEVFGSDNLIANIIWQKKYTRANDARWFSDNHDHILCYAKQKIGMSLNLLPRNEDQLAAYINPDNHEKGPWKATPLHAKSGSNTSEYAFKNGSVWKPPVGTFRRFNDETMRRMEDNDEIWFGSDGKQTPSRKSFLSDVKDGVSPVTIWPYDEVGHNHEASSELKELNIGGLFSNPKPTRLLQRAIQLSTDENDIVLDFFAGSSTTAHAVFKQNALDGKNRKFIMVQLPEETDVKSAAHEAGFDNISNLSKERIRRAGNTVIKGKCDANWRKDIGFRALVVDTSNLKDTFYAAETTAQSNLLNLVENVKSDRTDPEDLLFQVLVDWGVDLTLPINKQEVAGKTVFFVNEEPYDLIACFDYGVTEELVKELAKHEPARVVFRDNGFASDAVKINVEQIFKQLSPATDVKSI